ncbi:polysaccharide deacetylase [Leptospira kmetyi]|uniref:Polysaccharide deacetylase n=1 Tax=Leptospira kmetyi TaxID=408139 RepID=A0A5F1Y248_9LEPT|nr:polysaccharide deacetylase [Leptospira kmetyi]TGK23359.1 polysaccharide deacetylase [Leptospira kmetyi]TGK27397.1 polysaccharide deacetylase [Leptospira kmetyi]TGL64829.1 polysaccharide deacetylase [Leptospira kmetyi]
MADSFFFHKNSPQETVPENRIENLTDRSMNFQTRLKKGVFHLTRSYTAQS